MRCSVGVVRVGYVIALFTMSQSNSLQIKERFLSRKVVTWNIPEIRGCLMPYGGTRKCLLLKAWNRALARDELINLFAWIENCLTLYALNAFYYFVCGRGKLLDLIDSERFRLIHSTRCGVHHDVPPYWLNDVQNFESEFRRKTDNWHLCQWAYRLRHHHIDIMTGRVHSLIVIVAFFYCFNGQL